MTKTVMLNQLNKLFLGFILTYDLSELHCAVKIKTKAARLGRPHKFPFNLF
jgi:hypothetical protein